MAFPVLLLLAGGALVLGRKKKRRGAVTGGGGNRPPGPGPRPTAPGGMVARPQARPKGEPWDYCAPPGNPDGEYYAAFGEDGTCRVFWTPQTREVAMNSLGIEFNALSDAEQKALCASEPDINALVKRVCKKMFPQLEGHLPPMASDKYFPKMVWERVKGMFLVNFCGFNRVT